MESMPNVVLSRESLLFYQQYKMKAKLKTPELPTTKALQKRKAETEGEIKGVKSPQSAAASHNKLSINVLMNTPSHPLHIAAGELHCEPTGSKKKGSAKIKEKEFSLLQNVSKTEINETEKVCKKWDTRLRSKPDSKKQSADNIEEPVMTPECLGSRITNPSLQNPKRQRIASNVQSFATNMESVIGASAKNLSKNEKSNQTMEENLDGKTVFESPAKQLARKPTATIGTKTRGRKRSEKNLTISTNNCTELDKFSSIDGVKSAKSGRAKKKRGVPAGSDDGGTELSMSLPKRLMSTKQGLEINARALGPIMSGFNYESFSDKKADTHTTESEDDTCSSYTDIEEDVIFSKSGNTLKNRSRASSISPNIFETSKQKDKASESSLSPEFDQRQKLSKSLLGFVLPSPRKQLSLSDNSLAADRDLSTKKTDEQKNTKEKPLKSARNKSLLKNSSFFKSEASCISANASTLKEGINRKLVANAEFTLVTTHLLANGYSRSDFIKQGTGSTALKRKRSVGFTETYSPNIQLPSSLTASPYHKSPVDADKDLDVQEESPTQRSKMPYAEESVLELTNCRFTPSSISDLCTAVPMRTRHPTTFNLYMATSSYPVRARQLNSTEDFVVSWLYLQPTIIFPLHTSFRAMIMRLKGSVEFRSDPCVPSCTLLNSVAKLVELEAGRTFHITNTGKEVALIQMTEILR
ncbi:uncharacterized protein LOC116932790 isoform X2 [Daphnia magna]|uniref:uncharacterized protein LOC116932790 isoform X2 n=1 Tax=Daphnia magna TaxID=35525 RepID=UPI001E1B9F51|nr:uncharacterized protein LOC116932790 isoform X2 [Daphnia magna]